MNKNKKEQQPESVCSHCGRKGVILSLSPGQMSFTGGSFKIKKIDPNVKIDFCSTACLHEWIDKIIQE